MKLNCSLKSGVLFTIRAIERKTARDRVEAYSLFLIGLVKFRQNLTEEVVVQNLKRYRDIYREQGKDPVNLVDTRELRYCPDVRGSRQEAAMHMVMERADRMARVTLVAMPAYVKSPTGTA